MWSIQTLVLRLQLFFVLSASAQHVNYVKPTEPPFQDCFGEPCLTLEQYAREETSFISGSTFILLPGNHTIQSTVELMDMSGITFKGSDDNSTITVVCNNTFILCENVKNLTINGLIIELHSNHEQDFSALRVYRSAGIYVSRVTFRGSGKLSESGTRAVYSSRSVITITNSLFNGNTGYRGGAVLAVGGNITVTSSTFTGNSANKHGGAMYLVDCNALFSGRVIRFINNSGSQGGALCVERNEISTMHVVTNTEHLYFIGNNATVPRASAVFMKSVLFSLGEGMKNNHYFIDNLQSAIYCVDCRLKIAGNNSFVNNGRRALTGGGISLLLGDLTFTGNATFYHNNAEYGGAIDLDSSSAVLDGRIIEFENNTASEGGAVHSKESNLTIKAELLNFVTNAALETGGAISINTVHGGQYTDISSANFVGNTGECGGALSVTGDRNVTITDITATGNSVSALCIFSSRINFTGVTRITGNTGRLGGGMSSSSSTLIFTGQVEFKYNQALVGGAMYLLYGDVNFVSFLPRSSTHVVQFTHNIAERGGGAVYATGTSITLIRPVHFAYNSALNGGAMYLKLTAVLAVVRRLGGLLNASYNHASDFGGVIYNEDSAAFIQCEFNFRPYDDKKMYVRRVDELPDCPLQLEYSNFMVPAISYQNSARNGEFMYGGLLDRCRYNSGKNKKGVFTALEYLDVYSHISNNNIIITKEIASLPYQLCFCESNLEYNCSGGISLSIQRGQLVKISLIAFDQTMTPVPTSVTASLSSTVRLKLNQNPQFFPGNCSDVFYNIYNIYSTESHEELVLYPDGPCETGVAKAVVNATILPCPDAFTLTMSGEECECEERLRPLGARCVIDNTIYINKRAGSKFWTSHLSINGTYQGLVLYKTCPFEYCTKKTVNITLDDPDIQCDNYRGGVLCGKCIANYSLLFSGSQCQECPNTYLALLLPFAAAGIVLVVSLSILRLTVATGMINSVILYANILQVNKDLFFASNEQNVFTVFIAWLNLDLGFQTCFYHGMDAYAQTWLQFAFPLYVWIDPNQLDNSHQQILHHCV